MFNPGLHFTANSDTCDNAAGPCNQIKPAKMTPVLIGFVLGKSLFAGQSIIFDLLVNVDRSLICTIKGIPLGTFIKINCIYMIILHLEISYNRGSALQYGGLRQVGFLGVWTSALEQFARKHSSVRHFSKIQGSPQDTFI